MELICFRGLRRSLVSPVTPFLEHFSDYSDTLCKYRLLRHQSCLTDECSDSASETKSDDCILYPRCRAGNILVTREIRVRREERI